MYEEGMEHPLEAWRRRKGVTDTWIAEQIGCKRPQVSRIRRGLSRPSPRLAQSIQRLTRIKAMDLLTWEAPDAPEA